MMAGRRIKTAIIIDFMGTARYTPEEEIAQHVERFNELLSPDRIEVHTPDHPSLIEPGTELVIYDFGGLLPGCDDMIRSHVRSLIDWAENHPSALVLVVSYFTFSGSVQPEMEGLGLILPNIVCDDITGEEGPIPEWWLGRPLTPDFGVTELITPGLKSAVRSEE